LSEAAHVLSRPVTRADVRSIWVGLRPLVAPPKSEGGGTKTISREHTILVDANGLLTVTGGKWTTYRAMADDVMGRCFDSGLLPVRAGAGTDQYRLVGAPTPGSPSKAIHGAPGMHLYGTEQSAVAACPGADNDLGMGLTEAMVRYAVRREYAHTVEDVLARRSRALFLDARAAAKMAPAVADILASEGIGAPELDAFLALCRQYLPAPAAE
jgi:glycerol-3-phosphate dehydrogenase